MDSHIFRYSMSLAILLLSSVVGFSHAAAAPPACIEEDLKKVRGKIKAAKIAAEKETSIRPALQYADLDQTKMKELTTGQREEKYLDNVIYGMGLALKGFSEKGDSYDAGGRLFGWPEVRNDVKILRRPNAEADPDARANVTNPCVQDCRDMALHARQFYVSEGLSTKDVVNRLSQYKLATTSDSRIEYCTPRKSDCRNSAAFVKSNDPSPMAIGEPYLVDETQVIQFPFRNIVSRSLYQVTEVEVCGKTSYLVTSFLTNDKGSFDNASTTALVTQIKEKTVVVGEFQGYVGNGSGPVPAIFLSFPERATAKLAGMYNTQAEKVGSNERVNGVGRVPSLPKDQAVAVGGGASTGSGRSSGNRLQR